MTSNAVTIALYIVTVILVVSMILAFLRMGSASYNQSCAQQWIQSMDVVKNNQRYLGSRAVILADIDSRKKGALGYEVFLACRTPSRRAFYLSVTSVFGQVTAWDLMPVDFEEMIAALEEAEFDISKIADRENIPGSKPQEVAPQKTDAATSAPPEIVS